MSEILDKLHKIRELAEHGVGGEKTNAKRKLKELLKKYGLKYDDVFQAKQEKTWATFTYTDIPQRTILFQCYFRTRTDPTDEGRYKQLTDSRVALYLTPWEALEIAHMYSYYRKLWKKQLKDVLEVFVARHNLYAPKADEDDDSEKELTPEDVEKIRRLGQLYQGMERGDYKSTKRMLEDGEQESD